MCIVIKRFETADDTRMFEKGRFETIELGGVTLGRATYEPGWRWSEHLRADGASKSCQVEHVGIVVSGAAVAAMDDGTIIEMKAGDAFYIPPGHDSWVVGNEEYVSLHIAGANEYKTGHAAVT